MNPIKLKIAAFDPEDIQQQNEKRFCTKYINEDIDDAIRNDIASEEKVQKGVYFLNKWLNHWRAPLTDQTTSEKLYKSKKARLDALINLDIEELVRSIFVGIAYVEEPMLLVAVTAQLASKIGFDDKRDSILTMAEIVAVLAHTDAFDISRETLDGSVFVKNRLYVPEEIKQRIKNSQYLPPMVCPPKIVHNNFQSAHLSFNDGMVLGKGNNHEGDICLDVINTQNQIPLKLDLDFLKICEEEPKPGKVFEDLDEKYNWDLFKWQSYQMYLLMAQQGNKFYITNKPDSRIRLYAQGYHINPQGAAFKKAMIELHNEQLVEGAPS